MQKQNTAKSQTISKQKAPFCSANTVPIHIYYDQNFMQKQNTAKSQTTSKQTVSVTTGLASTNAQTDKEFLENIKVSIVSLYKFLKDRENKIKQHQVARSQTFASNQLIFLAKTNTLHRSTKQLTAKNSFAYDKGYLRQSFVKELAASPMELSNRAISSQNGTSNIEGEPQTNAKDTSTTSFFTYFTSLIPSCSMFSSCTQPEVDEHEMNLTTKVVKGRSPSC